ncbi:MAG: chemotaxis protein CheX [Spirochaetales bacterium]|nr:chemotaxis protein CheX [Spirochaetales bacterium]
MQLKVFIESIIEYFNKITGIPIDVGVPYLKEENKIFLLAYTAAIGISGKMRGAVYLTAEKEFLSELIRKIMPRPSLTDEQLTSMAGELANTIAGNAQKVFGSEFLISIPMIFTSENRDRAGFLNLQVPTFVIPMKWNENQAFLAIGLKEDL